MFSGSGSLEGLKIGGGFSASLDKASASGTGYKTGGCVKKTEKCLVHKGEYVLPVGVKPTKTQKEQVKEIKSKAKK